MLKTIAGEMNGIYMDEASHMNYRGEYVSRWFKWHCFSR
jgi:hypothetical protein